MHKAGVLWNPLHVPSYIFANNVFGGVLLKGLSDEIEMGLQGGMLGKLQLGDDPLMVLDITFCF